MYAARNSIIPEPIARQPWGMLIPLFLLVAFGAAVLYSAAGGSMNPYASSHLIRFGVFMVMASVIASLPREFVKFMAYPAYVVVLLMLVGVEVMGALRGGSQRWLDLGFMVLQPSELMKPVIVVVLAHFFASLPVGRQVPTSNMPCPTTAKCSGQRRQRRCRRHRHPRPLRLPKHFVRSASQTRWGRSLQHFGFAIHRSSSNAWCPPLCDQAVGSISAHGADRLIGT